MIDDILYDPSFFVFEVPDTPSDGSILSLSYDGDNFISTPPNVETITIFVA